MLSNRRIALGAVLAVAVSGMALAQTMPTQHPIESPPTQERMPQHPTQGMPTGAHKGMHTGGAALTIAVPTLAGQDAFAAIQEIVQILEADPNTDWSKVNLEALRQHLIDMSEVTLRAAAATTEIDGGLRVAVTGSAGTLAAIRRMIPAHAAEINGLHGWSVAAEPAPDGVLLTVTASDPKEIRHIRGLGFIGLLASGAHHQPHHLAMARGEFSHTN